jgi:hypothetical protein
MLMRQLSKPPTPSAKSAAVMAVIWVWAAGALWCFQSRVFGYCFQILPEQRGATTAPVYLSIWKSVVLRKVGHEDII